MCTFCTFRNRYICVYCVYTEFCMCVVWCVMVFTWYTVPGIALLYIVLVCSMYVVWYKKIWYTNVVLLVYYDDVVISCRLLCRPY